MNDEVDFFKLGMAFLVGENQEEFIKPAEKKEQQEKENEVL